MSRRTASGDCTAGSPPDRTVSTRVPPRRHRAAGSAAALAAGLAAVLTFALAGCTSSGTTTATTATATPSISAAPGALAQQQAFVNVIKRVLPSVVEIRTSSGLGSGVVYDKAGDIVTNAHVVGNATRFQVVLSSSTKPLPATLVGAYRPDDLAVVKVSGAKDLHPAVFGDSAKLRVGDIVLAIGNPLGLASSVTDGIVSAVGRTVSEPPESGSAGATIPDAIQTSAAINPGNSGGALVNIAGQVIGIPTLAAVNQQVGGTAPGIGFAISANTATNIARQLVSSGHVTNSHRAALGVRVTTVVDQAGTPAGAGIVSVTPGGPAAAAGLQAGDVITAVNGTATPDTQTLSAVLAGLNPGQTVTVAVTHPGGSTGSVRVKLGQLPGS